MIHHRHALTSIIALALTSALVVGCSPAPEPTPTPTAAFASEEEAFAAAEETYRAFTSRLNEVDTSDPTTFEPLFALSSGEFEKADREAYSTMHAEGLIVDGDTKILSFQGSKAVSPFTVVVADVCLDVRAVTVVDADGASHVDPDRPDVYALSVTFIYDETQLLIDSAIANQDFACDEL